MYNRYNLKIEICTLALLLLSILYTKFSEAFIVNLSLYIILSFVYYWITSPKIALKETKDTSGLGERVSISDDQKIQFFEKGVFYLGLTKLVIILFVIITVQSNVFPNSNFAFKILSTFILAGICLLLFGISNRYFLKAKGFVNARISNSLVYNNPDDKRAMIDKRSGGIGVEFNFGSKQGRLVFWVLISIPITLISLLILVFSLSGKI